ncbi:MAG: imidazolonepropionase [Pirellulaceae bacterium]|nr:imidazolonepropionase [Pirellulaceae bacterium]
MNGSSLTKIFRGFRLATMAPAGTVLARDSEGNGLFEQPDNPYGAIFDAVMSVTDGKIDWILPKSLAEQAIGVRNVATIEGRGRWLTPGLIDCHTHLVYGGNRAEEWEQRVRGVSYEEIARSGGGILSTVRATRESSEEELVQGALTRLAPLAREGITTIEIKSGYGLDLESELKMLRAARRLAAEVDVHVETTLLAAHAVPPEYSGRSDDYIDFVVNEIVPAAAPWCSAVDAFCERIAFSVPQTERVFDAAQAAGLPIKVHAEQLSRTGISIKAAERGALSVDHIEYLSAADCEVLAKHGTVATLLPGAYYYLREQQPPPVAALRALHVPMAVSTDANPGSSPIFSLLTAANMACVLFGLTPEEALNGITRNAARALGLLKSKGTLEPGKQADLADWNVNSPAEIVYALGQNPCVASYRGGRQRE